MSKTMDQQKIGQPALSGLLQRRLERRLAAAIFRAPYILLPLDGSGVLRRPRGPEAEASSGRRGPEARPRPVGSLRTLVADVLDETPVFSGARNLGAATLSVMALAALGPLRRVAEQLGRLGPGHPLDGLCPDRLAEADLTDQAGRLGAQCEQAVRHAAVRLAGTLQARLARRAVEMPATPRAIRFSDAQENPMQVRVDWLDDDDKSIVSESLRRTLAEAFAGRDDLADFCESVSRLGETKRALAAEGLARLESLYPALAGAATRAVQRGGPVAVVICTGRVRRGIPAELLLFLNSARRDWVQWGEATVSLHRAHRDFILGAAGPGEFYFPPCVLTGRMWLRGMDTGLYRPTIRQPGGAGYHFVHPYVGTLAAEGAFVEAEIDADGEGAAWPEACAPARQMFPRLNHRLGNPAESDLCLSGQDEEIRRIHQRLIESGRDWSERDCLGALTALHDLARIGLCRAHENNAATPRARLTEEAMPYSLGCPLSGRVGPAGELRRQLKGRIFTYSGKVR